MHKYYTRWTSAIFNNNWRKDSPYNQIREGILQITKYKNGGAN